MNDTQWARYEYWISVQNALIKQDCQGCVDLPGWFSVWNGPNGYVKNGGDVPPVKPPKP